MLPPPRATTTELDPSQWRFKIGVFDVCGTCRCARRARAHKDRPTGPMTALLVKSWCGATACLFSLASTHKKRHVSRGGEWVVGRGGRGGHCLWSRLTFNLPVALWASLEFSTVKAAAIELPRRRWSVIAVGWLPPALIPLAHGAAKEPTSPSPPGLRPLPVHAVAWANANVTRPAAGLVKG